MHSAEFYDSEDEDPAALLRRLRVEERMRTEGYAIEPNGAGSALIYRAGGRSFEVLVEAAAVSRAAVRAAGIEAGESDRVAERLADFLSIDRGGPATIVD